MEILNKFIEEKLSMYDFCLKYSIKQEELIKILQDNGYLYAHKGASTEKIINLKRASDEYLSNDTIYLEELCDKYHLSHSLLPKYLKEYLGIKIITRHKAKFNDVVFDTIDTEEKAYWLGFLYADGCLDSSPLDNSKKSKFQIELSLKIEDKEHLSKFCKFLDTSMIITETRCRCVVRSQHMWNILNSYGCTPKKSLTLEFPNLNIFKDTELIRHFLRGYFDGDGCVSYGNKEHTFLNIQLLGTKNFLEVYLKQCPEELQDLTLRHNHNNENESTMLFNTSHNKALIFLNYIYINSFIKLDRKFSRYFAHCNSDITEVGSKIGES